MSSPVWSFLGPDPPLISLRLRWSSWPEAPLLFLISFHGLEAWVRVRSELRLRWSSRPEAPLLFLISFHGLEVWVRVRSELRLRWSSRPEAPLLCLTSFHGLEVWVRVGSETQGLIFWLMGFGFCWVWWSFLGLIFGGCVLVFGSGFWVVMIWVINVWFLLEL